jgi:polyphosphate glucokinase
MNVLGIDIGGTGIKGAPVDVRKGELTGDRYRLLTPQPATPDAVARVVAQVVEKFETRGRIGCTFPAVIQHGVALTAANVDPSWKDTDVRATLERGTKRPFTVLNDADAAGVAEMEFGAGKRRKGLVVMLTLGTGIGSALFVDGILVPNTELGHLKMNGKDAEERASDHARDVKGLTWKQWGKRVNEYLQYVEALFSPELFIIGGGVSKKPEKFFEYLDTRAELVAAELRNEAGIVGAAVAAAKESRPRGSRQGRQVRPGRQTKSTSAGKASPKRSGRRASA